MLRDDLDAELLKADAPPDVIADARRLLAELAAEVERTGR